MLSAQLTIRVGLLMKLEIFQEGEWMGPDVDVGGIFPMHMYYSRISTDIAVHRKLMIQTVTGRL